MSTPFETSLIGDVVERIIASPSSIDCWHKLNKLYQEASQENREKVAANLLRFTPNDGIAGFLRETFLSTTSEAGTHLAEAGHILKAIQPVDSDRISAFLLFGWAKLLASSNDHAHYIQGFNAAQFPQLNQLAGQSLQQQSKEIMPVRPIKQVRRIAVLTSHVSTLAHTPTCMALDQIRILAALDYQVELFSAQEQTPPDMPGYLGSGSSSMTPDADPSKWGAYLQLNPQFSLNIHFGEKGFSMMRRWKCIMTKLAEFDPDLIFFIGLYSPLLIPLYQRRPMLALCTHATPPIAPVDTWLCANDDFANQRTSVWGAEIPDSYAWPHPYRVRHQPISTEVTRYTLGLPEDKLILISVGARLTSEIKEEWADQMKNFMQDHDEIIWLLVGGDGRMPEALNDYTGDNITTLPHQENIGTLLANSDIYINPPRIGGGFSVAEAMAESLPVIAIRGSDGGNKVGNLAVENIDAYFELLKQLILSKDTRLKIGKKMRTLFENNLSLDHSHQSLDAAIHKTLALYHQRVPQTE